MARFLFIASALLSLHVSAQTSSPYTDENTGISFRGYIDSSGFRLGLALPEDTNTTSDFIAQIQAPITNGGGWAGFSMGQTMAGNLLIAAWPNEGKIISSFRIATGYTNPAVTTGDFSMTLIPDGTFVNDTAFSYTFLCSKCISTEASTGLVVYESPSTNVMGWAFSNTALEDSTIASATLNFHSGGYGAFGIPLANATSAEFAKWAALATGKDSEAGNSTTPVSGGNSTIPAIGKNTTSIISTETFDYIVAGGGPAGIIAADRLAESGASVLLVERGGPSLASSGNNVTLGWNSSVTMYDVPGYGYYLADVGTPAYCTDTADMAGCLLGGGSSVNALMFVKPQKKDFDDKWPKGWKWDDVSMAADRVWKRNPGQTYGSMDQKRYNDEAFNVLSNFFEGQNWKETDFIKDPDAKHDVFGRPPWNVADGLRSGTVKTYLPFAQKLPNFKLMMNTNVVRAIRDGESITGVEVRGSTGDLVTYNVKAGGNVILAAGSMSTPRILFNSGIGPTEQLKKVANGTTGVKLPAEADWIDLPVGAEIKDHPIFTIKFNTSTSMYSPPSTAFTKPNETLVDLFAEGSGVLAQSGQRLNWWTSVKVDGKEMFFQGTCNGPANDTIQMKVYLTHGATSVGSLGITSSGATEFIVNPHMTSDMDKKAATAMMDRILRMTGGTNSSLTIIPPAGITNVTGADLIKTFTAGSHYVGTAKMGTKGEAGVVVDTNTKVYGTRNLFVVDASIHPDLPTGNTQAIVMVVAEAAAARILASNTPSNNATLPVRPEGANSTTSIIATPSQNITAPLPTNSTASVAKAYAQCGGQGWAGATQCLPGWTCEEQNPFYSQCVQSSNTRRGNLAAHLAKHSAHRLQRRGGTSSKLRKGPVVSDVDARELSPAWKLGI